MSQVSSIQATMISTMIYPILPIFTGDIPVCVVQLELFFSSNKNYSDQQHVYILLSFIPPSSVGELRDIVTIPPADATHSPLLHEILKRTSLSSEKKFRKLLNNKRLGDRTPSQMLGKCGSSRRKILMKVVA